MTNDSLIDVRSVTAKKDNLPTYQTFQHSTVETSG